MSEFHALRWEPVPADHFLPLPEQSLTPKYLDWHQSALHVVDHLNSSELAVLPISMGVGDAEHLLSRSDKRYAAVIDSENSIVGVLMARDLHGRQSGVVANLLQLPWHELTVGYIMTPLRRLPSITLTQVKQARIGDIAATMQEAGCDFIAITESDTLYGMIVSLRILAVTGESVRLYPRATSFAEVYSAIKHSDNSI
ncbi:CBS domain-containing protein [Pseudidiomarina andamanensis]|uniref:CBS domain-containing protein n=1 Tax=Pseudidiomarina andamanensis TaxID=1940690 RepID=A0AA92ILG0_9GAMM|nr:CBS domain-containing protein [Pseudidiomarina andamanensis]MDS0218349.1 hypothetical protein [Pseudidiomarina andamanensis]QGT95234.1 hypothetical protein D3795_03135 [Pseudidiomarina andamanensis]